MKRKIGFLFDLDGVIIDSESEYSRIWDAVDQVYPTGVKNFSLVIKGTTLPDILTRYFREEDREAVEQMCLDLESRMSYPFRPGSWEFLQRLRALGIPMALVTSSDDRKMAHLWEERPELVDFFDTVIDSTCVTRSKPDPQGYLLAAERLGLNPAQCVVVEDSLQGVKAGHAAGSVVVGVPGTLAADKLLPYANRLHIDLSTIDLDEMRELVRQNMVELVSAD